MRRSAVRDHLAFAWRVASRYRRRAIGGRPPGMVVGRRAALVPWGTVPSSVTMRLRVEPRIILHAPLDGGRPGRRARVSERREGRNTLSDRRFEAAPLNSVDRGVHDPSGLVGRLQRRRVERWSGTPGVVRSAPRPDGAESSPGRPGASARSVRPVPRVVVHSAAPSAPAEPSGHEPPGWGPASIPTLRPSAASVPGIPPMDLERLTDHVVEAIDRRLIAYRERRGRA
jgi:hypothetical protein